MGPVPVDKPIRSIERLAVVDRKTVRRYVAAGVEAGLVREGGEEQLNDVVVGAVKHPGVLRRLAGLGSQAAVA